MKARMPCPPALHFGVLMGSVVIANQVQLLVGGDGLVDQAEKLSNPALSAIFSTTCGTAQSVGNPVPCSLALEPSWYPFDAGRLFYSDDFA